MQTQARSSANSLGSTQWMALHKGSMRLKRIGEWIQYSGPNGRTFFFNESTGVFTWQRPLDLPPSPGDSSTSQRRPDESSTTHRRPDDTNHEHPPDRPFAQGQGANTNGDADASKYTCVNVQDDDEEDEDGACKEEEGGGRVDQYADREGSTGVEHTAAGMPAVTMERQDSAALLDMVSPQ